MKKEKKEAFCPAHEAFKILANKWSLIIIGELASGSLRFNRLKNSAGISARELSKRLEALEDIGAVDRRLVSEKPIKVEYSLTKAGKELAQTIEKIHEWTVRNKKVIKINYLNAVS